MYMYPTECTVDETTRTLDTSYNASRNIVQILFCELRVVHMYISPTHFSSP